MSESTRKGKARRGERREQSPEPTGPRTSTRSIDTDPEKPRSTPREDFGPPARGRAGDLDDDGDERPNYQHRKPEREHSPEHPQRSRRDFSPTHQHKSRHDPKISEYPADVQRSNPNALFPRHVSQPAQTPMGRFSQSLPTSQDLYMRQTQLQQRAKLEPTKQQVGLGRHTEDRAVQGPGDKVAPTQKQSEPAARTTYLSQLQHSFLPLSPTQDLNKWMAMIEAHPRFFEVEADAMKYLAEATDELASMGADSKRYKSCVEKAVLFRLVSGRDFKAQRQIFEDLHRQKPIIEKYRDIKQSLRKHCEHEVSRRKGKVKSTVPVQDATVDRDVRHATNAVRKLSMSSSGKPHAATETLQDSGRPAIEPGTRHSTDDTQQRRIQSSSRIPIGIAEEEIDVQKRTRGTSVTAEGEDEQVIDWIDPAYQRRNPRRAGTFFTVGRVFAIITHNEHGNPQEVETVTKWEVKKGNLLIISRPRRFVVVREGHGFCWAVPIYTYGGRGTLKRGLNAANINAHAIIHDSKARPGLLQGEKLTKSAISVDRSAEAEPLSVASRVNFEKVTSIEHNVRAMAVGVISDKSRSLFMSYWRQHLLGPD